MPTLLDPQLASLLDNDKARLEETDVPIVTVSASFKEDLKGMYGLPENEAIPDVVLSRAHYSMAMGIAAAAWGEKIDAKKAWLIDPTNYVSSKNWSQIILTETVGKTLARHPLLKFLKDIVDKFGRQKLPILGSITPPLLHLTQHIHKPILSMHIAAGNILAEQGHRVVQVITDPHVREDYLANAHRANITFCVFDDRTKTEFFEKAAIHGVAIPEEQRATKVVVTGPPVDPRVIKSRHHKQPWRSGPLKLCITTGGLGTNKEEILALLEQLLPELRSREPKYEIRVYAGTQRDIYEECKALAKKYHVKSAHLDSVHATPSRDPRTLVIMYHPQIVDANELLLHHGFPWADGFITKPSGDMAYDAAAAGCFLLTLAEWGEWEHNIREIFHQLGIARRAEVPHILAQLQALSSAEGQAQSWVEQAMHHAQQLDPSFLRGSQKILTAVKTADPHQK